MPKRVDSVAQRREIRDAARRVFARRGIAGTGLVQVAEAAGMGRSSLYHYYPGKDALVRDLARDLLAEEERLFAEVAAAEGRPLDRIAGLAAGLVGLFREWAAVGRVLLELRSSDTRRFRGFFRRIRANLARVVAEGQRRGEIASDLDPELAAATVIGAIDGLLLQHYVDPRAFGDLGALAAALERDVRRMLAP